MARIGNPASPGAEGNIRFQPANIPPIKRITVRIKRLVAPLGALFCFLVLFGCGTREKISGLGQLDGKEFVVPTGTVADQLVLSKLPKAKFKYFNSVMDAALAVKAGKADAAAYDEPILKNIAAKNSGLIVLKDMITGRQPDMRSFDGA